MRIGLFADTYPPYINGVATSTKMLKESLEKLGHTVFVVTINSEKYKYRYDTVNRILYVPGIPTSFYNYRLSFFYSIAALNYVRKMHLDVIHSQQEFGIGTLGIVLARQLNIPIVHTYHTEYEEYINYVSKGKLPKLTHYLLRDWSDVYCKHNADELIVPTKKIYDLFKNKYKYERHIHIIPTGIDLDRFYQKQDAGWLRYKYGLQDKFVILYLGRISFEKNIEFLLDAQKRIKNATLVIVGYGPDTEKDKEYAKENNLDVIFIPKVPWEETPLYYRLADVFVTASLTETQGLTVIEAMASSIPVIAIDDEAYKDTVIDKKTGRIFKTEDEYINIIDELSKNKKLVKKYGENACKYVKKYSSEEFALRVIEVYQNAIKNNTFKHKIVKTIKAEIS